MACNSAVWRRAFRRAFYGWRIQANELRFRQGEPADAIRRVEGFAVVWACIHPDQALRSGAHTAIRAAPTAQKMPHAAEAAAVLPDLRANRGPFGSGEGL